MPKVPFVIFEYNQAVIKILQKGRSNALRHINRTHRVSCDWLVMIRQLKEIYGKYVDTKAQAADILTKAFNKAEDFQRVPKITQLTRRPTNTAAKNPTPAGGDSVLASHQSNKTRNRPRRIRKTWNRSRGEGRRTEDNTNICVDDYQCYSCTHTLITAPLARFAQDGSRGRVDSLPRSPCTDRLGRSQQSFSAIQSGKLLLDSMQIPGFQPKVMAVLARDCFTSL